MLISQTLNKQRECFSWPTKKLQPFIILKGTVCQIVWALETSKIALLFYLESLLNLHFLNYVSSSNSWCWTYRQYMCLSPAEGAAKQG